MTDRRWDTARRVLCVRLDGLGDLLMTTPALRAVAGGGARSVTLLASPAGAALGPLLPELDRVVVHEAAWLKTPGSTASGRAELALVERLRRLRLDAAVVFTTATQSALPAALLCLLADIPLRAAHVRENPYRTLTDWVPEPEPDAPAMHEVRRQLALVGALGYRPVGDGLSVHVPHEAETRVRRRLDGLGLSHRRPWAVVHPGASAPSRRYPVDGFARAAELLAREHGWQIVVAGGPEDLPLVEAVRARVAAPTLSVAGDRPLAELAALLRLAPLLIANNSGPAHLAAAVGTPVVDLYALTNPQHAPWGVPARVLSHDVPCAGCLKSICPEGHHLCLRGVAPERVVQAALELTGAPAPVG